MPTPKETTEATPPVTPEATTPVVETDEDIEREMLKALGHDPDAKPPAGEVDDSLPVETETPNEQAEVSDPQAQAEEPAHERAGGGGEVAQPAAGTEQPAPEVVETAPQTPATPAQAPQATAAAAIPAPVVDALAEEMKTLTATIKADDFDPFSPEGKDILLRRQDVAAEISARAVRQELTQWDGYAEMYGGDAKTLEKLWKDEIAKAEKKYGANTREAQIVATDRWRERAEGIKATAKPPATPTPATPSKPAATAPVTPKGAVVKPPVAKTPITPQGARVVPPGVNAVPPPSRQLTDEEELVAYQRRNVPGGIHSLARG